jgi:hypothetical protein
MSLTKFWVSSARDFSLLSAKHWSRRVSPKLLLTNVQGSNYKSEYAAPEIFISITYLCEVQRGQKTKWVRQKMSMTTSRVYTGGKYLMDTISNTVLTSIECSRTRKWSCRWREMPNSKIHLNSKPYNHTIKAQSNKDLIKPLILLIHHPTLLFLVAIINMTSKSQNK